MDLRLLTAVALAAVTLTGCLGGDDPDDADTLLQGSDYLQWDRSLLSEPRFTSLPPQEVWITASTDSAQMHATLWLPDGVEDGWKAPLILVDTPYRTTDQRTDPLDANTPFGLDRYDWLITELVPRGYAVAYKEVRGTGESGGCIEQTASTQRQDGYDAVEWFAAQAWSNGHVGMFGKSYLAETQYGAAVLAPPHLTTIVPVASVSGQYEWNFYDGVPFTAQTLLGNAEYLAGSGAPPGTTPQGLVQYPTHVECQVEMMAQGLDMSGDWNDYWEDRELRKLFPDIEASVLYVHGLQDWNVRQVAVRDAWDRITSEKRLMLGQWHHDFPNGNSYNADWSRTDWRETVHAWYDHWLLEIDNGILESLPPVQIQDSEGTWRAEADYPPADAEDFVLHLAPGALVPDAPPAFTLALRENEEAFLGIPEQQTEQETELIFESEPLADDLRFSGWPVLRFDLALFDGLLPDPDSETDAHFAANLYVDDEWINVGYLSARHRDGVESPAPVPEGETISYGLRLSPADTVVRAGSTLKLVLAGSDDTAQPEGTLWAAELYGGTLTFPAVERDLDTVGLDVPLS